MVKPSAVEPDGRGPPNLEVAAMRGGIWLSIQSWTVNLASLVVFVILGRLLEPREFGLVAAASVVVLFLRLLVDAGVSQRLIQRVSLDSTVIDTAFWLAVGTGMVLTALNFVAAPLTSRLFGQPGLTPVVQALSPVILLASIDRTQSALLDRRMAFRSQALRAVFAATASAAVAIGLAVAGAGVWSLVSQSLVFEGVSVVLLWRLTDWRPRWRFQREALGELLGFGGKLGAIDILTYTVANLDNLLVGAFLGPVGLGIYVVAYRIMIVFDEVVSMVLRRVTLPVLSRLQQDQAAMNEGLYRITSASALVVLPVAVGLACLAPDFVPVVFGDKWLPSIPVMQVLAAAAVVQATVTPLRSYVIAMGRLGNELRWICGYTAAQVVGFLVAAQIGVVAVAMALSIVGIIYWPIRVASLRRLSGVRQSAYWRPWVVPALASAVMSGGVLLVRQALSTSPHVEPLLLGAATGSVLYLGVLCALDLARLRRVAATLRR